MDEDEPVAKRACLGCEDDYIMDIYSLVQPGQQSQLYLYLTKSGGQSRKTFLQVSVKKASCSVVFSEEMLYHQSLLSNYIELIEQILELNIALISVESL